MDTKKITTLEAVNMFLAYNKHLSMTGVAFSSITYFVDEAKSKTVNKAKLLQKLVTTNATIGSDYEKKVNKICKDKQGNEIDFKAQKMFGKSYVNDGNPVAMDDKTELKRYLVFIVENHTTPHSQLYKDGKPVNREDVWNEENITPAGLKPSNYTSGRGAVDKENDFAFRTLDFNNLMGFKMNGINYIVEK